LYAQTHFSPEILPLTGERGPAQWAGPLTLQDRLPFATAPSLWLELWLRHEVQPVRVLVH
jgi:hypothetical protein